MKPSLEELAVRYGLIAREVTLHHVPYASAEWAKLAPEDLPRVVAEPLNGSWTSDANNNYGNYKQKLLKAVAERWLQEHAG